MFRANDDGTFELVNIIGQSVLRPIPPGLPNGWFLKSVTLEGKDITDTMLDFTTSTISNVEVTFTQEQTEVTGTASDGRNAPITEFVAVFFPKTANSGRRTRDQSLQAGPIKKGISRSRDFHQAVTLPRLFRHSDPAAKSTTLNFFNDSKRPPRVLRSKRTKRNRSV